MPQHAVLARTMEQVAGEMGTYPVAAFLFVEQGLALTVRHLHGNKAASECRHITGQQLAEGLRQFACHRWGLLARTVLARWQITATLDFGRIVYAMIDAGLLSKTESDTIDDFREVYDFGQAFERQYQIDSTRMPA